MLLRRTMRRGRTMGMTERSDGVEAWPGATPFVDESLVEATDGTRALASRRSRARTWAAKLSWSWRGLMLSNSSAVLGRSMLRSISSRRSSRRALRRDDSCVSSA